MAKLNKALTELHNMAMLEMHPVSIQLDEPRHNS